MIVLLTDYGYLGPYVGQLKAKIYQYAPSATVIDLMHDLPAFNIDAAATIIPAITTNFPENTIFVCVVDPGVGSERKAVVIKADSNYYIGPDNGIFSYLNSICQNIKHWEIIWRPEKLSTSFHGRDLFIPIACKLHNTTLDFQADLKEYNQPTYLTQNSKPQIIYFDGFGNAITSINATISKETKLTVGNTIISNASVFSDVPVGNCFWYKNSMGLVEIACNKTSAKQMLNLSLAQHVALHTLC